MYYPIVEAYYPIVRVRRLYCWCSYVNGGSGGGMISAKDFWDARGVREGVMPRQRCWHRDAVVIW